MFTLTKALKSYREAGPLNEQINLLGFIDDHVFLTKSGDLGVVLSVTGVDYESAYDLDLGKLEAACAEFYKAFSVHDAQLYEERYNLLNAYLAAVPGNSAFNLRRMLLTNSNYGDYSFLFTLHSGRVENEHLQQEYLALLETNHRTPYFLNLHYRDVAHTIILGRSRSSRRTSRSSAAVPGKKPVAALPNLAALVGKKARSRERSGPGSPEWPPQSRS